MASEEPQRPGPPTVRTGVRCPTCGRGYAPSIQFCPEDGSALLIDLDALDGPEAPEGAGVDGGRTTPNRPSLLGQVLADRYRLVRKLGEGGMGEVYEAQHVYIERRVAIKTLRPEVVGNPEAVGRFQQEARAASSIGHENIVAIEDFGPLPGGGVYMAMEYLDGESLGERMRAGALPRELAIDVMLQVCRGLGAAHGKGIIHRDMKPENVFLVEKAGRTVAKILDFGIAKVTRAESAGPQLTRAGAVFGTPFYMAPEQALGRAIDARADVYSVGVILYEVFAGRVPFQGDSFMAILSQHITTVPLLPSRLAPERHVPPAIEKIIMRAMAKEPEHRFPSMAALAQALEAAVQRASHETFEGLGPPVPEARVELAEVPPSRRPAAPDPSLVPAPASRRGVLVAAALAVVAVGAGAVAMVARGPEAAPSAPPGRGVVAGAPAGGLPGAGSSEAIAGTVEIVLDSIPSGAKVLAGGKVIAETPEALRLTPGKPLEVLLHKDGYVPRQLTLDPERDGHKVIIKLEAQGHHHAGAAPPPPAGNAGGAALNPGVRTPAPDPYQYMPPPGRAPIRPKAGAPLDPYGK